MALTREAEMIRLICQESDGDGECRRVYEEQKDELKWVDFDYRAQEALIDLIVSILSVKKS